MLIPFKSNYAKVIFFAFVLIIGYSRVGAQPAETVTLEKLQALMAAKDQPIKVFNFWATWCAPCVKEMPLFEKLGAEKNEVQITFVSMDLDMDPNPDKVYRFIERKKLKSRVVILDAHDPNSYIDKIEKQWSGALPATILLNTTTGKRKFHEGELHEGDLEKLISDIK